MNENTEVQETEKPKFKESGIQWTTYTWNCHSGCKKVSPGCARCYMYRDKERWNQDPTTVIKATKAIFNKPLSIHSKLTGKEPIEQRLVFTCSWSDFFIEQADEWRDEAWDIIRKTPNLTYQILTKRPELIAKRLPKDWGNGWKNVWLGVSVESPNELWRVEELLSIEAQIRFVSIEPQLESISLDYYETSEGTMDFLSGILDNMKLEVANGGYNEVGGQYERPAIDWVIVGGESGHDVGKYRYRECKLEWIESIVQQCKESNTPVFVKQLGTHLAKELGLKDRKGGDFEDPKFPENLKIRQMPINSFYEEVYERENAEAMENLVQRYGSKEKAEEVLNEFSEEMDEWIDDELTKEK